MNNFSAIGRIGTQPEIKQLKSGDDAASFSVAVDSGYGEKKITTWLNVTLFGKKTGIVPYINKGDRIGVTGEIALREYTAKDGSKKSSLELGNASVTLLATKQEAHEKGAVKKEAVTSIDPFADEIGF
jgi:single-strand DNA-binding protein